jgi:hypothetical protein
LGVSVSELQNAVLNAITNSAENMKGNKRGVRHFQGLRLRAGGLYILDGAFFKDLLEYSKDIPIKR